MGSFQRERSGLIVARNLLRVFHVGVGMLEEPRQKFQSQHMAHGPIDVRLRDQPLLECFGEMRIHLAIRQIRIDTGFQRAGCGMSIVGLDSVDIDELVDRRVVARHRAFESHLAAQDVLQ